MNRTGMTVRMALQGEHITPCFELTGNIRDLANLVAAMEQIDQPTDESIAIKNSLWRLIRTCKAREE